MDDGASRQRTEADRVLAVLGGGQLGRMLAESAAPLGARCRIMDERDDASAFALGEACIGPFTDDTTLRRLADGADAITYEFENVPAAAITRLAELTGDAGRVNPNAASLLASQDRLREKDLFRELGIPTPAFVAVSDLESLHQAGERLGFPFLLKTRRLGYDGKGQFRFDEPSDIERQWPDAQRTLAASSDALRADAESASVSAEVDDLQARSGGVAEAFVPFDRELSVVLTRAVSGQTEAYPIPVNEHADGILRVSRSPAPQLDRRLADAAIAQAARLADHLGHVGTLCLELFQQGGELIANEFAPRVHNSGHWTIEACRSSQFENHARAVLGLPLGVAAFRPGVAGAAMINLIGSLPAPTELARLDRSMPAGAACFPHVYGKAPRPGRKVGHITVVAATEDALQLAIDAARPTHNA